MNSTREHTTKYLDYIKSDAWRDRKTLYYSIHPKVCRACGSDVSIHLHHRTYVRLTVELDIDLVPLCEPCHMAVHEYHVKRAPVSLGKATDHVIAYRSTPRKSKARGSSRGNVRTAVPCPRCMAAAGEYCVGVRGIRKSNHAERVRSALCLT